MSKGRMLSIFRSKADVAKPDVASSSKLALALYGPAARSAPPPPVAVPVEKPLPPMPELPHAKLVFAFDATASRAGAWATTTALTVSLLDALPGQLDVALAVHGGSKVHTFTRFESDARKLCDRVASVRCIAGETRLLPILAQVLKLDGVGTVVYVGDVFEESEGYALKLAVAMAARNIRLIILHDTGAEDVRDTRIFADMATLTGGCVLPFDASALPMLRELLSAVAVLAVGGTEMLAAKQESMPAARLLLQHLKEK